MRIFLLRPRVTIILGGLLVGVFFAGWMVQVDGVPAPTGALVQIPLQNCAGLRGAPRALCLRKLRTTCQSTYKNTIERARCMTAGMQPAIQKNASSSSLQPKKRPPSTRVPVSNDKNAAPPEPPPPPKVGCGDSIVLNEGCDDGNTANTDGCSSSCVVETGFVCNGSQPSLCWSLCGDGIVATNEQCDDGNVASLDGCSSKCKTELGYSCTGSPSVCAQPPYCGNGKVETGEVCDDGNPGSHDGCSSICVVESGYSCSGAPSSCSFTQVCGNGATEGTETCDDGNTSASDGCSETCHVEQSE